MGKDPWTDPDPQPGDFDAEIDRAHADQIEIHEGNPDPKLSTIVSVEGDAKRLERIATERSQQPARSSPNFCAAPELLKGSGSHCEA
jgi:hypothetical protein